MAKHPLKATDKRRSGSSNRVSTKIDDSETGNGAGSALGIFNDRRHANGHGKKAS